MADSLANIGWLASADGETWLKRLAGETEPSPNQIMRLRKELTAEQTHLLLEQVELRQRAKEKFPLASDMLFTRRGLEQSTDAHTARFKAERFPAGSTFHDLCCGIGGDAIALAQRGSCRVIDRDPAMTFVAEHNAKVCECNNVSAVCDDVTSESAVAAIGPHDFWHIDPDRRPGERRHSRVEGYQPGIDFLQSLVRIGRGGTIKLAPAADLPEELDEHVELEWISRGGECKQQVAWYGELASSPSKRTATALDRKGAVLGRFSASAEERRPSQAEAIGQYVLDPDASLLASGLTEPYAAHADLRLVDGYSKYLTGDRLPNDGIVAAFEVLDVLSLDVRRLKQALAAHGIGRLEWKKRGVEIELPKLATQCKAKGDQPGVVIVTPWRNGTAAIIGRRLRH